MTLAASSCIAHDPSPTLNQTNLNTLVSGYAKLVTISPILNLGLLIIYDLLIKKKQPVWIATDTI
jgi:hypothetical protein